MNWILSNYGVILEVVSAVIGTATLITGLTPSPADDAILAKIVSFLSFVTHKDAAGSLKLPMAPHK